VPMFLPEILPAVEVGWRFDPGFWGKGYATEGASAALEQGFSTLGLERICSVPQSENPPSGKVCQRIGMTFERQTAIPANNRRSELSADLYWMSAADWRQFNAET
jgi:RimJ/RimL family protein N-acetyltransferase